MILQAKLSGSSRRPRMRSAAEAARERLAQHPHFRGRVGLFEFEVCGDVLTVRGRTPTFYLKQLVQAVLKDLEGVRRVDNQIDVTSSAGLSSEPPHPRRRSA